MIKTNCRIRTLSILVILSLFFPALALAQSLDELPNSGTPELAPSQVREDLRTLELELHRIETEFDAYNPAIAEVSLDIADRLVDRGNFSDALVAYRRALHLIRINEGLETDRQIPILENIIETQYKLGEYEEAGNNLERLSAIYSHTFGNMDPELIPHLMDRGDWHMAAFFHGFGNSTLQHLIEAQKAYGQVADIREKAEMPYDPLIYSILSSVNYNTAVFLENTDTNSSLNSSYLQSENGGATGYAGNSYRRGKIQLEKGFELAKKSSDQGHAILALVQLADWEQLFRKRFSARENYMEAYRQTRELDPEHELYGFFNAPKLLPAFGVSELNRPRRGRETTPVLLSMDITAWGTSRNVRVHESDTEDQNARVQRAAIRTANSSVFRPVIVDGEPVRSTNVSQTVVVPI